MRQRVLFAVTLLGVFTIGVHVSAQQARDRGRNDEGRGGDRVCFYRDVQFQGQEWCYRPGDELADLRNQRNEISSIRITGRARVVVYDEREFLGVSDEFDSDIPDLTLRNMEGRRSWNDRIDSFEIFTMGNRRRGRFGAFGGVFGDNRNDRDDRPNAPARDRICVFEEPNYQGRSECWNAGEDVTNLSRGFGLNDRISSVRVYGRARADVYRDADFRGGRLRITRDTPDLNALSWGDQISSIEVR